MRQVITGFNADDLFLPHARRQIKLFSADIGHTKITLFIILWSYDFVNLPLSILRSLSKSAYGIDYELNMVFIAI